MLSIYPKYFSRHFFENKLIGFVISLVYDTITCASYMSTALAFGMIYISVCLFIGAIVDDISATIPQLNRAIGQPNLITASLIEIIKLQLHCYRFYKIFLFNILKFSFSYTVFGILNKKCGKEKS